MWRAPTNASKWRMGFNSAFKGLKMPFATVCSEWCLIQRRYQLLILYSGEGKRIKEYGALVER